MNGGLHFVLAELFEEVLPRLHRTRGPVCTGMRARASSPHVPVGGHARTHILSRARGHARTRILSRARGMPVRAAQVLLCFTRDPVVAQRSAHPRPTPLVSRNRANQRAAFPPNEVPPGRGLADLVCPLCFVYAQPPERYDRVRLLLSPAPAPSLTFPLLLSPSFAGTRSRPSCTTASVSSGAARSHAHDAQIPVNHSCRALGAPLTPLRCACACCQVPLLVQAADLLVGARHAAAVAQALRGLAAGAIARLPCPSPPVSARLYPSLPFSARLTPSRASRACCRSARPPCACTCSG